jgi:cyclophilin family peptidyl-prolyl cis-trans isomerase
MQNHVDDVRLVMLDTWLAERDNDEAAFKAVEAANLQGKYWEMTGLLFENLDAWRHLSSPEYQTWVVRQAVSLGMDAARFQQDLAGELVQTLLQEAAPTSETSALSPPTVYINGSIPYLVDYASLETMVSMEVLTAHQFSACPPWGIDPSKQYLATLHTELGDVVMQLFPDKTPLAVNNFVFLARSGWYDNIPFYRVIPGSMVETGDPSGSGLGNPGYLFDTEISPGLYFSQAGMVAFENNGVNTNGSRFFITLAPHADLDGTSAIFGQVLTGMDVLQNLAPRDPQAGAPLQPAVEIISLTIQER